MVQNWTTRARGVKCDLILSSGLVFADSIQEILDWQILWYILWYVNGIIFAYSMVYLHYILWILAYCMVWFNIEFWTRICWFRSIDSMAGKGWKVLMDDADRCKIPSFAKSGPTSNQPKFYPFLGVFYSSGSFKGYRFISSSSAETLTSHGIETYDGEIQIISNFWSQNFPFQY